MTKNPLYNALAALVYIILVVLILTFGEHFASDASEFLAPIAMLCLLTLSAATMGYIFFYIPIQLYLDGKKKEGLKLFTQTLGIFAGMTALVLAIAFIL